MEDKKIIQTESDLDNGQTKCPKCGATEISLNLKSGLLRCNFCRHEFEAEKTKGWIEDISSLEGEYVGSGSKNIDTESEKNIVTLKCKSCGAEVVIDTSEKTQARCHWCRNTLSVNEQVPNGMVPDVVLPFKLPKKEAKNRIENFVNKRKFFVNKKFKNEFCSDNVIGVYLPYVIVDINSHATFIGQGEEEAASYLIGDEDKERVYDANLYDVSRDFDLTIEGLTVESSRDKLNKSNSNKTNNIINSIMPFDTQNCVKWDANLLRGFNSEKRDVDIDKLKPIVSVQSKDIARHSINPTLDLYDRGVRWDKEEVNIKGTQWKTAYLPVWLYSYMEKKGNNNLLHYVAVNARTSETMGSVPINIFKLVITSIIVELFSGIVKLQIDKLIETNLTWLLLTSGILFYIFMYSRYRNKGARHTYEIETKKKVLNLKKQDIFVRKKTRLRNSSMQDANNTRVDG